MLFSFLNLYSNLLLRLLFGVRWHISDMDDFECLECLKCIGEIALFGVLRSERPLGHGDEQDPESELHLHGPTEPLLGDEHAAVGVDRPVHGACWGDGLYPARQGRQLCDGSAGARDRDCADHRDGR